MSSVALGEKSEKMMMIQVKPACFPIQCFKRVLLVEEDKKTTFFFHTPIRTVILTCKTQQYWQNTTFHKMF